MNRCESPTSAIERARNWYEQYGCLLHQRCCALLRDPVAADDALQDTFLRVLRYGATCRGDSVLAWLKRISDRCCFDLLRRHRQHSELVQVIAADERQCEPSSAWPAYRVDNARLLAQLLGRCKPGIQEVAVRFYLDEMTLEEIAREMDCSTMTIKRRLSAFRRLADRTLKAEAARRARCG